MKNKSVICKICQVCGFRYLKDIQNLVFKHYVYMMKQRKMVLIFRHISHDLNVSVQAYCVYAQV